MKKLISILFLGILLSSCNKDTLESTNNTVREKLTGKNWQLIQNGEDANGNGIPDNNGVPGGNELKYSDTTLSFVFMLNDNGTGTLSFTNPDTSANASLTWTLDPGDTYITSTVPALNKTVVSKIITITNSSILGIIDTAANPKMFVYFTREGF